MALLLLAGPVQAQPVCLTEDIIPQQNPPHSGSVGSVSFVVPPHGVGQYHSYAFPAGASRVGLIQWYHQFPSAPKGSLHIWGLVCRSGAHCHFANVTNNLERNSEDKALSRPLNPGEVFLVGMWNYTETPQTFEFFVTGQVCR